MDYSGPVVSPALSGAVTEGITYFDHPSNPSHPTHWHVREDGWMGASACFAEPFTTTKAAPLVLRYLLHAHADQPDPARANSIFDQFAKRTPFTVTKATVKHETWTVRRGESLGSIPVG